MNINIIAVGKVREKFVKLGVDEFLKRIQPYSSIKVTEIDAEDLKYDTAKSVETEADKILSKINAHSFVIAMDVKGNKLSSESFAEKMRSINTAGVNQLVFVIGGAVGLSKRVKERADFSLSMSDLTFPHQISRLILLEQIYRVFKIINNEPYHK